MPHSIVSYDGNSGPSPGEPDREVNGKLYGFATACLTYTEADYQCDEYKRRGFESFRRKKAVNSGRVFEVWQVFIHPAPEKYKPESAA